MQIFLIAEQISEHNLNWISNGAGVFCAIFLHSFCISNFRIMVKQLGSRWSGSFGIFYLRWISIEIGLQVLQNVCNILSYSTLIFWSHFFLFIAFFPAWNLFFWGFFFVALEKIYIKASMDKTGEPMMIYCVSICLAWTIHILSDAVANKWGEILQYFSNPLYKIQVKWHRLNHVRDEIVNDDTWRKQGKM